jgi:hypothetical protein
MQGSPLPPLPPKSPFFIVQDFISPLLCEHIIALTYDDTFDPNVDKDGKPIMMKKMHDAVEDLICERIKTEIVPKIENHFNVKYRSINDLQIEWYPEGCNNSNFVCENSSYLRKKWVKTKDRDFTMVLFLCDYQSQVPFDGDFEVFGGKLEFPQYGFGFNPQRGTLIIYPSLPHFINVTTQILAGDLFQVRLQMTTEMPYLHNPGLFTGDYRTWFREVT